jgi:AcrR family transcriptional regulator
MAASEEIPRRLPRGSHGLDPELVAASQRSRLLEAIGHAVAERGYAGATIEDVVRRASVSKKTFYEHFRDKEDCFLAAYDAASDECFRHVIAAQRGGDDWLDGTRAGIRAYLRWLAAEPALARVYLVEVLAAGPRAAERRERIHRRYGEALMELREPERPELPPEVFQAVVAAVDELVSRRIREGRTDLEELEPVLLYLEVALLAGRDAADALADG